MTPLPKVRITLLALTCRTARNSVDRWLAHYPIRTFRNDHRLPPGSDTWQRGIHPMLRDALWRAYRDLAAPIARLQNRHPC